MGVVTRVSGVKAKGIAVKEAEDNLEGVELAKGDIIGLYLTTQGFSAITATRKAILLETVSTQQWRKEILGAGGLKPKVVQSSLKVQDTRHSPRCHSSLQLQDSWVAAPKDSSVVKP